MTMTVRKSGSFLAAPRERESCKANIESEKALILILSAYPYSSEERTSVLTVGRDSVKIAASASSTRINRK